MSNPTPADFGLHVPKKSEAPEPGHTSVRLGPAFIRPAEEKDHYELMRPILTVRNEGDGKVVSEQHEKPIGPIAVYRLQGKGDKVDLTPPGFGPPKHMKTVHPKTGEPILLTLVWHPQMGGDGT